MNSDQTIKAITDIFATVVPATYIADGHHRAASAAKVRKALGQQATPEANYFLTTLFPSNQLYIMDYNRVVKDLNGLTEAELLQKLAADFTVEKIAAPLAPENLHEFGMYIKGQWYKLTSKEGTYTTDPDWCPRRIYTFQQCAR